MLSEQHRFEIGERIRTARNKIGLSQMEFAESINISVNFLSEIENGKKGFSYETLYNICKIHGLSADYILFGTTPKDRPHEQLLEISRSMSCEDLKLSIEYLNALQKMKEAQEKVQ